MNKNYTDISGNLVTLNLQDLQETARIAVGSLANKTIQYGELIREELNKAPYKKEDRESFGISTSLNAQWLEGVAKGLVVAARALDAVYAADSRDEIIVLK